MVDGAGEGFDAQAHAGQRVRLVAGGAEHGGAAPGGGLEPGRVVGVAQPLQPAQAITHGVGLLFVVKAQDVEAVILFGVGVVDPAAPGLGVVAAGVAAVAQAAVHLVADRQHHVGRGQDLTAGVARHHLDERIKVLAAVVVVGGEGNAFGFPPALVGVERKRSRLGGGRGVALKPHVGREGRAKKAGGVVPEVGLAVAVGVDAAVHTRGGLVGELDARGDDRAVLALQLGVQVVVGRQDRENRVVAVHEVHAQVVPGGQDVVLLRGVVRPPAAGRWVTAPAAAGRRTSSQYD